MSQKPQQELVRKIEAAFADTPYPGDENIGVENYPEGVRLQMDFQGKHWKDIPLKLIDEYYHDLAFLIPAAFRFYLPALLIADLLHFGEMDMLLDMNLIIYLTPPIARPEPKLSTINWVKDYWKKQHEESNSEESAATLDMLRAYERLQSEGRIVAVDIERLMKHFLERVAAFSTKEKDAIMAFLEHYADLYPQDYKDDVDRAREFWVNSTED